MRHLLGLGMLAAAMLAASPAVAADVADRARPAQQADKFDSRFNCSAFAAGWSRMPFNNSGGFGTTGPALLVVPECSDKMSGFYVMTPMIIPLQNFDVGKEVDALVGWRGKFAGLEWDVRAGGYFFTVAPGSPVYSTGNIRVVASKTLEFGDLKFKPYAIGDFQHAFTPFTGEAFAVAGGLDINYQFKRLPLTPILGAKLEVWDYLMHDLAAGRGPIWSFNPSLTLIVNKNLLFGAQYMWMSGDLGRPIDFTPKQAWGGFASVKF